MNLFRFLRRPIRTSVPAPQPVPPAKVARETADHVPTPDHVPTRVPASPPSPRDIRRLLFDAVASGDESRLHALCKEHESLIIQHSEAWVEVPPEFRKSPELQEWYANGLRAIRDYCAQRAADHELTEGIRAVLDTAAVRPTDFSEQEH